MSCIAYLYFFQWRMAFGRIILAIAGAVSRDENCGCSAFGHSCYGGHGKRSDPESAADIEVLPRNAKDDGRVDYEIGRPNGDNVLLQQVPAQAFNRQEQRLINSLHERPNFNAWSLLVRKLLLPLNRQYKTYEETE